MREETLIERLRDWLSEKWRDFTCKHYKIITLFTAETFTKDDWERCSGVGICKDCGRDFTILIAANEDERKSPDYLGY